MTRYYAIAERPWITDDLGDYWGLPAGTMGAVDLAPLGSERYVFATKDTPFASGDVAIAIGDGTRLQSYVATSSERSALQALLGVSYSTGWTLLDWLWSALGDQSDPDGELRAKPIIPTHSGVLELHLGGHSLIRSQRMPNDPTQLPAWPQIQRVLQNDYRAIREQARSDHRLGELHKKWLGAQQRKYKLTPAAARDLIGDPRDGLPMRPTTTITESFNQADSTTLGPDLTWTETNGDLETRSNRVGEVGKDGFGEARAESDLSSADMESRLDIYGDHIASTDDLRTLVRFDPSDRTHYGAIAQGSDTIVLYKRISATFTQLASASQAYLSDGSDYIMCRADGSTVSSVLSGVVISSSTDTSITSYTRSGIAVRNRTEGDNFSASDLLADAAVVIPPPVLQMQMAGI